MTIFCKCSILMRVLKHITLFFPFYDPLALFVSFMYYMGVLTHSLSIQDLYPVVCISLDKVLALGSIRTLFNIVLSSPEPNAQESYCHSALSVVVRPSVRKISHFQLLLQNRLMDFDETW